MRTFARWTRAFRWSAWMACLGACGCAAFEREEQLRAARETIWATYGGKDGAGCTLTGAPQPDQPTYILNIEGTGSTADASLEGESRGLDPQTAERLNVALQRRARSLLACVRDLDGPAKLEVTFRDRLSLTDAATYGLERSQLDCLVAELRRSLAGVDYGQTRLLRLRFRLPYPVTGTAPAHPTAGRGSLSKSVIADVIADHIGEIRGCYEHSLVGWPDLAGSVAVKFIIQPDGSVHPAAVASTTLHHKPAECCITNAVRSWQFPPPDGGGIVVVTYPFVLEQVSGAK